jgi:hypothetical protein
VGCQVFLAQQVSQDPREIVGPLDYLEYQERKVTRGLQVCRILNMAVVTYSVLRPCDYYEVLSIHSYKILTIKNNLQGGKKQICFLVKCRIQYLTF